MKQEHPNRIKLVKLAFTTLLVTSCLCFVQAQSALEDIVAINRTYHNTASFMMDISVCLYEKAADQTASVTYAGCVKKDKQSYYNEMMGQITIMNERCVLMVDKSLKRIVYSGSSQGKDNLQDAQLVNIVDSLVKTYGGISLVNSSSMTRTYSLTPKSKYSMYDHVLVSIDVKLKVISRLVYFYVQGSQYEKVIIDYTNIQLGCKVPSGVFSETSYIIKTASSISPTKAYKGFRVIQRPNPTN